MHFKRQYPTSKFSHFRKAFSKGYAKESWLGKISFLLALIDGVSALLIYSFNIWGIKQDAFKAFVIIVTQLLIIIIALAIYAVSASIKRAIALYEQDRREEILNRYRRLVDRKVQQHEKQCYSKIKRLFYYLHLSDHELRSVMPRKKVFTGYEQRVQRYLNGCCNRLAAILATFFQNEICFGVEIVAITPGACLHTVASDDESSNSLKVYSICGNLKGEKAFDIADTAFSYFLNGNPGERMLVEDGRLIMPARFEVSGSDPKIQYELAAFLIVTAQKQNKPADGEVFKHNGKIKPLVMNVAGSFADRFFVILKGFKATEINNLEQLCNSKYVLCRKAL